MDAISQTLIEKAETGMAGALNALRDAPLGQPECDYWAEKMTEAISDLQAATARLLEARAPERRFVRR